MKEIITNSSEDTINLAQKIASKLDDNDILVLTRRIGNRKNKIYRRNIKISWVGKRNIESNIYNSK